MSHFMLSIGVIISFLYISYVSGSSLYSTHDIRSSQNHATWLHPKSAIRGTKWVSTSTSITNNNNQPTNRSLYGIYPQIDGRKIEDLLNKSHELMNAQNNELYQDIIIANRSDNFIDSTTGFNSSPPQLSSSSYNADSSIDPANELEKVELHTNNHQSSMSSTLNNLANQNNHNSRHYSSYQVNSANSLTGHPPLSAHYNKYTASHSHGSSSFSNNLNLNYIHNLLLTKPATSSSLSGLLNFNSNSLALTSSPYGLSLQNGYVSSYYSSPSLATSSANSIQQTSSAKEFQLSEFSSPPSNQDNQTSNLTTNSNDFNLSSLCGKQQVGAREPRIVGGNSTYEGEFPWAVSIQRQGNHHCGGVIVGKRWILTAAHCVRSQLVGNLIVRTGGHTLTRSSNHLTSHLGRDYLVEQIVMHDDFSRYDNLTASQMKSSANTNNADIALLKLKHDIHWNELAWPVCFPNREAGNFSGHDAVVIGWGKLNEKSEDFSNELQKVKLTIIDNKVCHNWFRQAGRDMPIDDRIICAGFKNGGKDACHGDSGGPLLSKINGHYVVVGVVSTGIGCARPLLPGLYSRVSSYIGWIERHVS